LADRPPALISVDWGTSSFRAYLSDVQGVALDSIARGEGALGLKAGEHEPYLVKQLSHWKTKHPELPVIASGMVGSRQGWVEAPYANCPAGIAEIAAATIFVPCAALGGVRIVPGVSSRDARGAPDVMRGEETQILGALAASSGDRGLFVLPGTHSKWARVEDGRIIGFETFMTGEVFAVLKEHSVLGRMMAPPREGGGRAGFALGLEAAQALKAPGDLLHAIFMTRTLALFNQVTPDQLPEYLSGLLVGAEILAGARGAKAATLIGAPALAERYIEAGAELGVAMTAAPENCATLGQIAVLKGRRGSTE
jgi:2-dehydro-3-deoxygalactonokinase